MGTIAAQSDRQRLFRSRFRRRFKPDVSTPEEIARLAVENDVHVVGAPHWLPVIKR